MADILTWLREEERRLREKVGITHGRSEQYHRRSLQNQADRISEAAREIEQLRALLAQSPEK